LSKRRMKKSIRIGDGVAEFFGTHDGNIKYLESLLKVQVHIDNENNLTIDGDDHNVELVERLVEDYAQLRSEGVKFANGDLKSIIRIISEDTTQSLRGVVSSSKALQAGKRNVTPKTLNQKLYLEAIEKYDMVFGIGPAGTGKNLPGCQHGCEVLTREEGQPDRPDPPGSRSRRAAWVSSGDVAGENRSVFETTV